MKKLLLATLALLFSYTFFSNQQPIIPKETSSPKSEQKADNSDAIIASAYSNHENNRQVSGQGVVSKILPDDKKGSRHQKFLVRLASGQTLLIAHNIDLADKISSLREGDTVEFSGEYEWNDRGGVIHWTHQDPNGSHLAGWLLHHGKRYQ